MAEPAHLGVTRTAYDTVAVDYARMLEDELATKPLDRALLGVFAEQVRADGLGPVADVGCGPGRVTAHLHGLGVPAFGVDLSPGMVEEARRRHPRLRFDVAPMHALGLEDGGLGGVLAWYSVIHTPPGLLPASFAELHRVLAPGGRLLLAFQVGDEHVHREVAYGHPVPLDSYRLHPDLVADLLVEAGFVVDTRVVREPSASYELTPQAYLLGRRPA